MYLHPFKLLQIHREHDRFNYICGVQDLYGLPFDEAVHYSVRRYVALLSVYQVDIYGAKVFINFIMRNGCKQFFCINIILEN